MLGNTRTYIKLSFRNVLDLQGVRRVLLPAAKQNLAKMSVLDTYAEVVSAADRDGGGIEYEPISAKGGEGLDHIVDIREYDIPYTIRVAIDKGIIDDLCSNCRGHHMNSSVYLTVIMAPWS